jgi:hypothetical protein
MLNEELELRRREFLRVAGGSAFMSLAAGTGLAMFTTSAWSAHHMKALTENEGHALLAFARTLFPHDFLADSFYGVVVNGIDEKAGASADTHKMVSDGVAQVERLARKNFDNQSFAQLTEKNRVRILKTVEKSPFFGFMYGETLGGLYGNPEIWKIFGYEGSSVEHGGYLERGFDDISWLPKE